MYLILNVAALWSVWRWIAVRLRDGSDEPWSAVPLLTLAVLAVLKRPGRPVSWLWPSILLIVYALTFPWLSPLPRAAIGLSSLALALSQYWFGRALQPGVLGLCWLCIPLMASLEFYVGYPLRLVSAELARHLLQLSGLDLERQGLSLLFEGREVAVDPACSGIKMLWGTGYALSVLACWLPLSSVRWWIAGAWALGLLVAGNAWRTAALFHSEAGLIELPPWAHEAVGGVVFAGILVALGQVWQRLARRQLPDSPASTRVRYRLGVSLAAAAAFAAALLPEAARAGAAAPAFPGWPTHRAGAPLVPQPLSPELAELHRRFPGKAAEFRAGSRRVVLRWLTEPTRRLHPAQHCFRASGYRIEQPGSCQLGAERYGCFVARRGPQTVRVYERFHGPRGGSFTDVSAWYWAALLGRSQGPWWVETIAEAAPGPPS